MSKELSRLDLYLAYGKEAYTNTNRENELVNKFVTLYTEAKSKHDSSPQCNPNNLEKWRKAYDGTLNALDQDGNESKRKSRQLRKMVFEIVESLVDNSLPMPKMQARYKTDLPVVNITEQYLKFEMDRVLSKIENDRAERATYVDGTGWYKVWWDSMDNTHERSGDVKVEFCTADQIIPQPGVKDYRQLEYIFERKTLTVSRIYDLYGRVIPETVNGLVDTVSCYYLNDNGIVGLFMWAEGSNLVICNEEDWQIRKIRHCKRCDAIVPVGEQCPVCLSKSFVFKNAEIEVLEEDLLEVYNPYDVGETEDESKRDELKTKVFLPKNSEIPFYRVRQLPFVPRVAISTPDSIYGTSEAKIILEDQDAVNKLMTKALDKTLKSGAVVTKPEKMKLGDTDESFKIFGVRSAEEASMVQAKQIVADTSQDITMATLLYSGAKQASGVTEAYQGQHDSSATSGKAKEYSAIQAAGRIESLRVMKAAAISGVYELFLKYLLAFSDEPRRFVRVLPDGQEKEESWSKYMFLDRDRNNAVYYRDDFHFDSDPASTLSQNRAQMWQETQNKFIQGAFGVPNDPRTLKLFWNVMNSLQYPLAGVALAGIKENEQHLPPEIEQAIMQNPQLMQMIMQVLQSQADGRGGARENSGPKGNGATHAANVERTNERNRAEKKSEAFTPQSSTAQTLAGGIL